MLYCTAPSAPLVDSPDSICEDWTLLCEKQKWIAIFVVYPLRSELKYHRLLFNTPLQWRHNEHDHVSNHQPHDCLLKRLFRRRSKKTSKLRVTGLCEGNSSVTSEFPAQRASNAENVSIWWRHHWSRDNMAHMWQVYDILKCISLWNFCIMIVMSLTFVPSGPINNKSSLV